MAKDVDKLVILAIGDGNLAEVSPVTLSISEDGKQILKLTATLPPAVEILQYYDEWQKAYSDSPTIRKAFRIAIPNEQITNVSSEDGEDTDRRRWQLYQEAAGNFQDKLEQWLDNTEFYRLWIQVIQQVRSNQTARIIIATNNSKLWKLPWHLWALNHSCNSEPAIWTSDFVRSPITSLRTPVKILAIFGDSAGINLEPDRKILARLEKRGAKITWLKQPKPNELREQLSGQAWDMLCFAGHSFSNENNGYIQLNQKDRISIAELKQRFRDAVRKGLKLAIFNSCDGLGIARNLAEVNLPHVIVMREPVPDRVAQRFLELFLENFSQENSSLNQAVRYARESLKEEETDYELPCASWLPVVYENPTTPPLIWKQSWLSRLTRALVSIRPSLKRSLAMIAIFIVTIIIAIWVKYLFDPPPQQASNIHNVELTITPKLNDHNDQINDRMSLGKKALLPNPTQDKQTGIEKFSKGDYQGAIAAFQKSLTQNRNDPETLIYLNNAQAQDKNPLKIAVAVPIGSNVNIAQEMLRGVAMAQKEINQNWGINGKWLQIEIVNDENNPTIAQQLAEKLVKDNSILAVVGSNASNASLAAAPVYQKGELVEITPTSYADGLSGFGSYIFRTVPNTRNLAEPLAQYMVKTARKTKVAVCYDSGAPDTVSFKDQFVAALSSKGGNVVPTVCDLNVPTFNANEAIADAGNSGADSLLLCSHVDRLEKAIDLAHANQGRLALFGPPVLYTIRTLQLGQGDVKGLVLSVPWNPKIGAAQAAFAQQARQQWGGDVSWRTASSYDATRAIIVGLQQNQTRDGLQSILRSPGFVATGSNGEVKFLPTGDRAGKGILIQVQSIPSGYEFIPIQP